MRGFSVSILVLMTLCVVGCKPSVPDGIIREKKMEEILYDYHMAMGLAEAEEGDVSENRYIRVRQVFDKHHITEAEFDSSMVYWCKRAEVLTKMMRRVSERIDKKAEILGVNSEQQVHDAYASLGEDGDTANVWKGSTFRVVLATTRQNVFRFIIPADSTYQRGDTFLWVFTPQMIYSGSRNDVYIQFSVQYENDSVAAVTRTIYDNRPVTMEIGNRLIQKNQRIKQVSGCVYMKPLDKGGFAMTTLSHIALVRYHQKKVEREQRDTIVAAPVDSVSVDTAGRTRLSPHEVRGNEAKERTINIVQEKNTRWVRRKR